MTKLSRASSLFGFQTPSSPPSTVRALNIFLSCIFLGGGMFLGSTLVDIVAPHMMKGYSFDCSIDDDDISFGTSTSVTMETNAIKRGAIGSRTSTSTGTIVELIPSSSFYAISKRIRKQKQPKIKNLMPSKRMFSKMPAESKETFFSDGWKNSHRFQRAFREQGWRKVNEEKYARVIYSDWNDPSYTMRDMESWQRCNHILNSSKTISNQWNYIDQWKEYEKSQEELRPAQRRDAYFLPEMYRLFHSEDRERMTKNFFPSSQKGMHSLEYHKQGVTPSYFHSNLDQKRRILKLEPEDKRTGFSKTRDLSWVGQYICDQLTYNDISNVNGDEVEEEEQSLVIRVFWLVASMNPLMVFYQDGYARIGVDRHDNIGNYYVDKNAISFNQFETHLTKWWKSSTKRGNEKISSSRSKMLKTIDDPVEHVRKQFKESIAITVDAFYKNVFDIERLKEKRQSVEAEDSFELFAADFVIDRDLDVWLSKLHTDTPFYENYGPHREIDFEIYPFLLEDYYFLVRKNHELFHGMLTLLTELWDKQVEGKPILPLKHTNNWELIVAGYKKWSFEYPEYHKKKNKRNRRNHKKRINCQLPKMAKQRNWELVDYDDDSVPLWGLKPADDENED